MASAQQPRLSPFSIVVGLKFTDGGAYAFDQAARMARGIPSSALHLVHVFEKELSRAESEQMVQHLKLYANEKAASLGGLDLRTAGVHIRSGEPARAIVALASDVSANLIVLGSDKHAIPSWFSSPTAEQTIATAPCPVLVAGPKPAPPALAEPTIEPPCPDCVARRTETGGNEWWCARHAERALLAHTFSYQRELPFSTHDSQLGPTGV